MSHITCVIHVVFLLLSLLLLDATQRIVHGDPVSGTSFPWMVSIRINVSSVSYHAHTCGASLINNNPVIILTAAHCVDTYIQDDNGTIYYYVDNVTQYETQVYFDFGRTFPTKYNASDNYYTLSLSNISSQLYIHPDWNSSLLLGGNDIALIILKNENLIDITTIPTIIDQLNPEEYCCSNFEELELIGYGQNQTDGVGAEQLEETQVKYINNSLCNKMWADALIELGYAPFDNVDNHIICILGNDTDICQGDSGGPLFRTFNNEIEIIGVTSFTVLGCNSGVPSGYTSIGHYNDWINQVIYSVFPTEQPTSNPSLNPTTSSPSLPPTTLNPTTSSPSAYPTTYPSDNPIMDTTFPIIDVSVSESIGMTSSVSDDGGDGIDISNNFYIFEAILSTLLVMCFL